MLRLPPVSTRPDPLFPYTTLFLSIFAFSHASADVRFRISAPGGSSEVNGNLPGPESCDAALSLHALDADLRSDRSGKVPHQPVFVDRRQLSMVHRIPLHLFRSEEHTSELQSLMRISYAVFCL